MWHRRIATALASLLACGLCAQTEAGHRRPNILFALADDWGWPHAGALGDPVVRTPTFDAVARDGVLFERAFVSSPSCTPSRNAILTGQHFYRLGEGANLHSTLDVRHANFMHLLADDGYQIGHWRKAWGPGDWRAQGYRRHPCGERSTLREFLRKRDSAKPFCFWFGTSDPHRGYVRHSGRDHGIDPNDVKVPTFLPDRAEVRGDLADYYFEVQRWDRDVGEALRLLADEGVLDDTIVVMTGDHGMPFPRCKANLYDHGVRVPLAIRWTRHGVRGRRVQAFVSLTDLAPTFLEAAGIDVPESMTGRSVLAYVQDVDEPPADPEREQIVFGRERHTPAQRMPSIDGYPARGLRTDRWLLIENFEPSRWPAGVPDGATHPMTQFADCDNGPTKQLLIAEHENPAIRAFYRLCFARRPALELYDCHADPDQVRNLAALPEHVATAEALRRRLHAHLRATGDPRVGSEAAPFDVYPYRAGYLQKHIDRATGR